MFARTKGGLLSKSLMASVESVNESGDESGLRVDAAPHRPPFSSPLASTELDRKMGETAVMLPKPQ